MSLELAKPRIRICLLEMVSDDISLLVRDLLRKLVLLSIERTKYLPGAIEQSSVGLLTEEKPPNGFSSSSCPTYLEAGRFDGLSVLQGN